MLEVSVLFKTESGMEDAYGSALSIFEALE